MTNLSLTARKIRSLKKRQKKVLMHNFQKVWQKFSFKGVESLNTKSSPPFLCTLLLGLLLCGKNMNCQIRLAREIFKRPKISLPAKKVAHP